HNRCRWSLSRAREFTCSIVRSGESFIRTYRRNFSVLLAKTQRHAPRSVLAARSLETLGDRIREQHVERRQGTVASGDVLLNGDLFFVGQRRVRVDALFEDAQLVANHHDLVKKALERHSLLRRALPSRAKHHLAALPAGTEVRFADAELFAQHLG